MKTAVSVPDSLYQAAERLAKKLGITRSRLYSHALERYVSEAADHAVTARLNKVYKQESSGLDPVLETLQELSIRREAW